MNIPYCILKEQQCISPKAFEYHQILAKRLYNSNKKNQSLNISPQSNYSKRKIYSWLFNLDFNIRMKICCIYNDWFSKILYQLLTYNEYEMSIKFKPTECYENFYKKLNKNFDEENLNYKNYIIKEEENPKEKENFNTFFEYISNSSDKQANKNHIREKDFLKELKFITINDINDTLTLSMELLKSKSKLQEYFDTFSNCKIFSENIISFKVKNTNLFNFSFPNWVENYKCFSIHQLIVIYFEQIISIYYQIYLNDNVIPKFEIDSKINDLLSMNMNMENYLGKEEINSDIFNLEIIINEVNSPKQKKFIQYYENLSENVYTIAFNRDKSEFFNDEDIKYTEINKAIVMLKKEYKNNISNFVNTISLIDVSHAFKTENIIFNLIYQKLSILCSEKNIDDLCKVTKEKPKKKNKKRKNKKHNKNSNKDENNEAESNEINSNNLNFDNLKENNINSKNSISEDNNNDDYDYNNINNNLNSINSTDNRNNNSEEEYDNIFSNRYCNNFPESFERLGETTNIEKKGSDCIIEMKDLNENGKEIKKEEEEKEINKSDLLEELMEMDLKEKNKKKKKKKKKNKKKKENYIEKNNEEKNKNEKDDKEKINIIKENITQNNIKNIEEIKSENITKENNNNIIEKINLDEKNQNNKKKYKEFFLFTDNKKKKDSKNKQINNNNKDKENKSDKDKNNIKDEFSKATIKENNKIEKINDKPLIKNNDLIATNESKIQFTGIKINENDTDKPINIIDNSNKINYLSQFNKAHIINANNPTINNFIFCEKEKDLFQNSPFFIDNFNYKMNNNIFISPNSNVSSSFYPPLLPSFNYPMIYHQMPNYFINEQKELFNSFSKEILSYEEKINNNLNLLKQYREKILNEIKTFIEKTLKDNNFAGQLINYGSYETQLSIEVSDIDILIKFCKINNINNQQHLEEVISFIYNKLNDNKNDFNILEINAIYTASVPVLKIKCNLENIIPNDIKNSIKKDYLFNFEEEILQLNFDFTFLEVNNLNENKFIPSLEIVSYIKKEINNFKEIKPIVLFLKRYMKINKLNYSFHGGISSYSLFLLVNAFIKAMNFPENSIGQYLYGFFEFYSNFNFGIYSINVSQYNPFILLNELHESGIMLIDPITKLNVAKSTFKVDQIKSVLMKGMIIIRNIIYMKIFENNRYNIDNDKTTFLDELFKYKNGSIVIKQFSNEL